MTVDCSTLANTAPALLPLAKALKLVAPDASIRTGRRFIADGKLPATKIGREYFVDPADVAELFRPRLRPMQTITRETPSQREARQLAEAGIVIAK